MRILLYIIWFGVAVLFFALWLWSRLEEWSGKTRKENPGDFFKQGCFVLACATICFLVDHYMLSKLTEEELPLGIPLLFIQIILFPLVLYVAALLIGPTKVIRIEKAARPTEIIEKRRRH